MTFTSALQETQNLKSVFSNLNSQVSHFTDLLNQYVDGDTSVKAQIDNIFADIKDLLEEKNEFLESFEELSALFQTLSESVESLEDSVEDANTFKVADEKSENEIVIKFSDFRKLLSLGSVDTLEGSVTYSLRTDSREAHKTGQTFDLKLNDYGKVRPPIDRLQDEDELVITNIEISAKNGSYFSFNDVHALLSVFLK